MGKGSEDYTGKSKAIEELVSATKENTPEYSPEELSKYKTPSKIKLPTLSKALLLKFWFAGVVCYFIVWGLGMYIPSSLDLYFVTALVMGFVVDILQNNIFRFIAKEDGEYDKWMIFPKKGYMSLIFNVIYSFLVVFMVYFTYTVLNAILMKITGKTGVVIFAMEPFTFGLFYLAFDSIFLALKRLGKKIIGDAKRKAKGDE